MKRLLFLLLATISLTASAQQNKLKNLEITNSLKFGNTTVTGISKDSTTTYGAADKLITEKAAKAYARSVGGGGSADSSLFATITRLRDSLNAQTLQRSWLRGNTVAGGQIEFVKDVVDGGWVNVYSPPLDGYMRMQPNKFLHYNGANWLSINMPSLSGLTDRTITFPDASGTVALTSNIPAYPSAGIPLSTGSAWSTSITNNSSDWNAAYTDRLKWDGGATGLNAATGRASLGGTTVGQNFFTLANPSAIRWPRINADNTVSVRTAAQTLLDIGGTLQGVTNNGSITTNNVTMASDGTNEIQAYNDGGGGVRLIINVSGSAANFYSYGTEFWDGVSTNLLIKRPASISGSKVQEFQDASGIIALTNGNVATATALATPRNINSVPFDGTSDITVAASASTLTGSTLAAGIVNSSLTSFGANPAFTGIPTAPTATTPTNTTQVATTAFTHAVVQQTISDSAFQVVNPVAATYPLALPINSTKLMIKGLKASTNVTITANADSTYSIAAAGGSGITPKTEREMYNYNLFSDASLVSYYRLENLNDSKGSNTLTDHNTVPFNAGKFNNAADFGTANTNKYLSAGNLGIAGNVNMSISCWVKVRTEPSAATFVFVGHASSSGADRSLQIKYREASGVKYVEVDAGGTGNISFVKTLGTSNWHHLVVTRNVVSARVALYIDGVLVQVENLGGSGPGGFDAFGIGSSFEGTNFASAYVEDVAVFSRVLSPVEIAQLAVISPDIEVGTSPVNVYSPVNRNAVLGNPLNNFSTSDQTIAAATTAIVTGSRISVPSGGLQIGSYYTVKLALSKTAAGTAACSFLVKLGTTGTTSDATIATLSLPTATGVADKGTIDITVLVRGPITASAVANCNLAMVHNLQTTGLANIPGVVVNTNSSTFDATASGLILTIACTTAASTVYTFQQVFAELKNN